MAITESAPGLVESLWRQQNVWSKTANRLKRDLSRWRLVALALTVSGAVLATLGAQLHHHHAIVGNALVWAGAIAVGLVPVLRSQQGPGAVESWTRARSASESLKEQIYTYLAGVAPYRGDGAQVALRDKVNALLETVGDLEAKTAGISPDTRTLPAVSDVASYIAVRVRGQIDGYYRGQAGRLRARSRLVHGLQLAMSVAAVVLAATVSVLHVQGVAAWVPVVTTVGAAIAAHAAAARYDYLLVEYARTTAQLQRLCDGYSSGAPPGRPDDLDVLVAECEHVISAQNEAWMSKLSSTTT